MIHWQIVFHSDETPGIIFISVSHIPEGESSNKSVLSVGGDITFGC